MIADSYKNTNTCADIKHGKLKNNEEVLGNSNINKKHENNTERHHCLMEENLYPLLFSIFINDLIHVTDKLNFIMYADDTTIYFSLEDFDPATRERY